MMRTGVKPIIFLLNNSGYTIERYLHGEKRKYNDISTWYAPLPLLFRILILCVRVVSVAAVHLLSGAIFEKSRKELRTMAAKRQEEQKTAANVEVGYRGGPGRDEDSGIHSVSKLRAISCEHQCQSRNGHTQAMPAC